MSGRKCKVITRLFHSVFARAPYRTRWERKGGQWNYQQSERRVLRRLWLKVKGDERAFVAALGLIRAGVPKAA